MVIGAAEPSCRLDCSGVLNVGGITSEAALAYGLSTAGASVWTNQIKKPRWFDQRGFSFISRVFETRLLSEALTSRWNHRERVVQSVAENPRTLVGAVCLLSRFHGCHQMAATMIAHWTFFKQLIDGRHIDVGTA